MKSYPLAKPKITKADIKAVNRVLKSAHLSRGPMVAKFEKETCKVAKVKHACAVSSGSAGLIVALQALDVSKGDEVITVSFTVPATVNSIIAVGAQPVMVDIEEDTYGMCPQEMQAAITKNTKAIIVVHAFGKSAKITEIISLAKAHGIPVIEDSCEAIGNNYDGKPLGSLADIGVYAFYPNKQITTGEGGMLVTNNTQLYEQFELLRNHGRSMNGDLYDQISFGWNFRMSDINAALGLSQLKRLKKIVKKRSKIAGYYQKYLSKNKNIICPSFSNKEKTSAWFVYVVQLKGVSRDEVMKALQKQSIQCGRYFAPVHLQPYYQKLLPNLDLPITEKIAEQALALPFYHELNKKDVKFICRELLSYT